MDSEHSVALPVNVVVALIPVITTVVIATHNRVLSSKLL